MLLPLKTLPFKKIVTLDGSVNFLEVEFLYTNLDFLISRKFIKPLRVKIFLKGKVLQIKEYTTKTH